MAMQWKSLRVLFAPLQRIVFLVFVVLASACEHGIDIVGEGAVSSSSGTRDCSTTTAPCTFQILGTYQESFTALPDEGFYLKEWQNCNSEGTPVCTFNIPGSVVTQFYGQTMPSAVAVFEAISVVTLSASSAQPGEFLTINSDVIQRGEDLGVTFSDGTDFDVTLTASPREDGIAKIAVPAYYDTQTEDFGPGEVQIMIHGGEDVAFEIEALPELVGVEAGGMVDAYLRVLQDNFEFYLGSMDEFETKYGVDAAESKAYLQAQLNEIEAILDELDTRGTLSSSSEYFGTTTLSEGELSQIDQLLYAMLLGIQNEMDEPIQIIIGQASTEKARLEDDTFATDTVRSAARNLYLPTQGDTSAAEAIRTAARNLHLPTMPAQFNKQFQAHVHSMDSSLKTLVKKGGGPGEAIFNTFFQVKVAMAKLIALGVSNSIEELNHFAWKGEYQASDESRALFEEVLKLPRGRLADLLRETRSGTEKYLPVVKWILENKCAEGIRDVNVFCQAEPSHLTVASAEFEPTVVALGEPAYLDILIWDDLTSNDYAKSSTIKVDWDAQKAGSTITELKWGEAHGHKSPVGETRLAHTYRLEEGEQSRTFTAQVFVTGDNTDYRSDRLANVLVRQAIPPFTLDLDGPSSRIANELGKWAIQVNGGTGPYKGAIRWGDGKGGETASKSGRFAGKHRYTTAGSYTISVTVTDSTGTETHINYSVTVTGEPGTCRLEYYSYYVSSVPGSILLSGDPDYPTITWFREDGLGAAELYIEAAYSSNVYHLIGTADGDIPNTVKYGDYGYPGTQPGEYCYMSTSPCTDVVPLTEESHFEYGYRLFIHTNAGYSDMILDFYNLSEVCD